MRTGGPISELDLLAYVDGQLDELRRVEVEAHLAAHPEVAARVTADVAINDGIRRMFTGYGASPIPDHLARVISPRVPTAAAGRRLRGFAAGLALVMVGAGGGWLAAADRHRHSLEIDRFAAGALMRTQLAEDKPADFLGERLRRLVAPPDLRRQGYALVDQMLVGDPERPAVQLTYADGTGSQIELFLQPRWDLGQGPPEVREVAGQGMVTWAKGPAIFALTGRGVSVQKLRELAQEVSADGEEAVPVGGPAKPG